MTNGPNQRCFSGPEKTNKVPGKARCLSLFTQLRTERDRRPGVGARQTVTRADDTCTEKNADISGIPLSALPGYEGTQTEGLHARSKAGRKRPRCCWGLVAA